MNQYTYDTEVFAHDWLAIFKKYLEEKWIVIHNDPQGLKDFLLQQEPVCVGFNSKNYDQFIIRAILSGFDMEEVKQLNDFLIEGGSGWEYPPLIGTGNFGFRNVDIMLDMQLGMSLKAIECHLGMSIVETSVPFDLPRPLNQHQLEETIFYCKHDVAATEKVVELRQKYLKTKVDIGKMAGLEDYKAMSMTNAKLTAALLKATPKMHDDERDYVIPANLKLQYIPQEVLDFYNRIHDPNVTDDEFFKSNMTMSIGDCKINLAMGGIHGAIDHYLWKEDDKHE